jgi:hypothetical protein
MSNHCQIIQGCRSFRNRVIRGGISPAREVKPDLARQLILQHLAIIISPHHSVPPWAVDIEGAWRLAEGGFFRSFFPHQFRGGRDPKSCFHLLKPNRRLWRLNVRLDGGLGLLNRPVFAGIPLPRLALCAPGWSDSGGVEPRMPANVAFPTLTPNLTHRCYIVTHPWLHCIQILDVLHPNGRISWLYCIHIHGYIASSGLATFGSSPQGDPP